MEKDINRQHAQTSEHPEQVVRYRGAPVVTLAMIDALHGRPSGTAQRTLQANRRRLTANEDYYPIDYAEKDVLHTFGIEVPPRGLTLMSESGYLLLTKTFRDDKAWEIQRMLVRNYFRARPLLDGADAARPGNLPDLKAMPILAYELDRLRRAVQIITSAAKQDIHTGLPKSWEKKLQQEPLQRTITPRTVPDPDSLEQSIWNDLLQLAGARAPETIQRGALPRMWAFLNHMNRYYTGGSVSISTKKTKMLPQLVGPVQPAASVLHLPLHAALPKRIVAILDSGAEEGITNVAALTNYTQKQLLAFPNVGRNTIAVVEAKLGEYGLRLGMSPDEVVDASKT